MRNTRRFFPQTKTEQAQKYEYTYQENKERTVRMRQERQRKEKLENGVTGPPTTLNERSINRLFDNRRSFSGQMILDQESKNDISTTQHSLRDQNMGIGTYTLGGLKSQRAESFKPTITHADHNTTFEKLRQARQLHMDRILSRDDQLRESSYDGDNIYHKCMRSESIE